MDCAAEIFAFSAAGVFTLVPENPPGTPFPVVVLIFVGTVGSLGVGALGSVGDGKLGTDGELALGDGSDDTDGADVDGSPRVIRCLLHRRQEQILHQP